MASLQIRDLPDDVYEALSWRARQEGRSLAQQAVADLRRVPELSARARRMEMIKTLREEIAAGGTMPDTTGEPEDLIRQDRER